MRLSLPSRPKEGRRRPQGRPSLVTCSRSKAAALSIALLTGCAGQRVQGPPPAPPKEPVIVATPVIITPTDDELPGAKLSRGLALLAQGDAAGAARLFDEVASASHDPAIVP